MKKIERYKRKVNNFFYDHYILKKILKEFGGFLIGALSAFIFAFGFSIFILPNEPFSDMNIATGGVSGLSQLTALIVRICGGNISAGTITAIGYTCFNIPLVIFAFFAIGKRFSIQTALNVGLSSVFMILVPQIGGGQFMKDILETGKNTLAETNEIALTTSIGALPIMRVVIGGVFVGLSSAICFKGEFSCGGIDIITYYLSNKKSTSVGKFGISLNSAIIAVYAILTAVENGYNWGLAIGPVFYSLIYIVVLNIVVDMINLRNKKLRIEVITTDSHMGEILIANFPHGATYHPAKGVYSGRDKDVIWMVVSSNEVPKVVKLARKVDTHAFISVTSLVQVYGNFYIKPIN